MLDFVRALASYSPQGAAYWRARRRWSVAALAIGAYISALLIGLAALTLWR